MLGIADLAAWEFALFINGISSLSSLSMSGILLLKPGMELKTYEFEDTVLEQHTIKKELVTEIKTAEVLAVYLANRKRELLLVCE